MRQADLRKIIIALTIILLCGCRADEPVDDDKLLRTLAALRAQGFVAGVIGKKGGSIVVSEGPLAGTRIDIAPGTVDRDEIFHAAATSPVAEEGYIEGGPSVSFGTTASELRLSPAIQVPIDRDFPFAEVDTWLLLHRTPDKLVPVGGALRTGSVIGAVVHELGDFGSAIEAASLDGELPDDEYASCKSMPGSISMQTAIVLTRAGARPSLPDPLLFRITSDSLDQCGRATEWRVTWYNTEKKMTEIAWSAGGGWPQPQVRALTCLQSIAPLKPEVDSTKLYHDFGEYIGKIPPQAKLETFSCSQPTAYIRLSEPDTNEWAHYNNDGARIAGSKGP